MFKIIMILLMIPAMVFGQVTDADRADDEWHIHTIGDEIELGSSATAYTASCRLTNSDHHALWIRPASASTGTVSFVITAEYSINKNSGFAACSSPVTFDTINALGGKPVKLTGLAHIPYIRFKMASGASQASDVKVDVFLIKDSKQR